MERKSWITMTGLGIAAIYSFLLMFDVIDSKPAAEAFMMVIIGFGINRKLAATKRAAENPSETRQKERVKESLEDKIRRSQK